MAIYTDVRDIESYCMQEDWDGEGAEALAQETVDFCEVLIDLTKGLAYSVEALPSGCVEITFFITNKAELKVFVTEKSHTIGFLNGNLDFDKKLSNTMVRETAEAVLGFHQFYSLVYA